MVDRPQISKPQRPLAPAVCADPPDGLWLRRAAQLADELGVPMIGEPCSQGVEMLLVVTPERLELRVINGPENLRGGRAVCVDLSRLDTTSAAGRRLRQPIAKAIGLRRGKPPPFIIDATAGFGQDSWILASLGCRVAAVERSKLVAALLRDGLDRVAHCHPSVHARLQLICADAADVLKQTRVAHGQLPVPDVVYIDPMYPTGRKTAERKPMRVLRHLVGDDDDIAATFEMALLAARQRVVVKRPRYCRPMGEPTAVHHGKAARYEVYATGRA